MEKDNAIADLLQKKLEAAMLAGRVRGVKPIKVAVSVRLDPTTTVMLDVMAEALGESRTGFATELLTAAVDEALKRFKGFPEPQSKEWHEQFGERYRKIVGEDADQWTDEELADLGEDKS